MGLLLEHHVVQQAHRTSDRVHRRLVSGGSNHFWSNFKKRRLYLVDHKGTCKDSRSRQNKYRKFFTNKR